MNIKSTRLISIGTSFIRRFSTSAMENLKPIESSPSPSPSPSLYRILTSLARTGETVEDTLYNHITEGQTFTFDDLRSCVKGLRNYNHPHIALELMQWMLDIGNVFTGGDYAVFIDLLSKVKGVDSAEEYFNKLSPRVKNAQTYGALLNCYCRQKLKDKAFSLFAKMNELNIASNSLNYNNLMSLCMKLGEPKKVLPLVQEMKAKGVEMDTCSYNILINCYAALKDIGGVERVVDEMESGDSEKCDSTTYSSMALVYVSASFHDKVELALKKLERNIKLSGHDRTPYHILISLYARTENLSEVHRVWKALQLAFPSAINTSYIVMLDALAKLGDVEGLKKCFREWESGCSSHDPRVMNVLIRAYIKRGMINDVKLLCEDAIKRGSGLAYTTYEIFIDFFLRKRQSSMALSCFEVGLSKLKGNKRKPCQGRVSALLKLLEEEKNGTDVQRFCKMLKRTAFDSTETPDKGHEFGMSSEMELLEIVCQKLTFTFERNRR